MKITAALPLPGYRLELRFEDGAQGIVDLSTLAGRGVFAAWKEPGVFQQVTITDQGAITWPGELDLCADALYMQLTGKPAEAVFPGLTKPLSHA